MTARPRKISVTVMKSFLVFGIFMGGLLGGVAIRGLFGHDDRTASVALLVIAAVCVVLGYWGLGWRKSNRSARRS